MIHLGTPEIIYVSFTVLSLMLRARRDLQVPAKFQKLGEKVGYVLTFLFMIVLMQGLKLGLLYWGGFFS